MKNVFLVVSVFFYSTFNAQLGNSFTDRVVEIFIPRVEFTSINGKSFFSFGPKIPLNEKNYMSLRGHFNWWDAPGRKFVVIPELDYFSKVVSFDGDKAIIRQLYAGAGITPNALTPKIGVNFYRVIGVEFGYSKEFKGYKHFSTEGFYCSAGLNLLL